MCLATLRSTLTSQHTIYRMALSRALTWFGVFPQYQLVQSLKTLTGMRRQTQNINREMHSPEKDPNKP